MTYILLFCVFFINTIYFDYCGRNKYKGVLYNFELLLLIIVAGFRFLIGTDTIIYYYSWSEVPTFTELWTFNYSEAKYNILWYVFSAVCKSICDDFIFFQLVQAIIINSVFFWFFKKYTRYFFSASLFYLCFFYLYFNTEILREIMSICCFMLSIPSLLKRRWLKYYLGCLIALGFHYSSIIIFLLPLFIHLLDKDVNWKKTTLYGLLLSLSIPFLFTLIDFIVHFINIPVISLKFEIYSAISRNMNGMIVLGVLPAIPRLILLIIDPHDQKDIDKNILWRKIVCISFLLNLSNAWFIIIGSRLANYLEPIFIIYTINIIVPYLRRKNVIRHIQIYIFIILILIDSIQAFSFKKDEVTPNYVFYYPYTSIFFSDPQIISYREYYNYWIRNLI